MLDAVIKPWLALHCRALGGVRRGLVVLRPRGCAPSLAAVWPEAPSATPEAADGLVGVASAVLGQPKGTARPLRVGAGPPITQLAVPFGGDQGFGVVALEVAHAGGEEPRLACKRIAEELTRAVAWLEQLRSAAGLDTRLARILEVVGAGFEAEDPREAATAVVSELARQLGCERVSAGMLGRRSMKVLALSTAASFDPRSTMIQDLERAMEESADQDRCIVRPASDGDASTVGLAADALRRSGGAAAVCCVPLPARGKVIGALALEHANPSAFVGEVRTTLEGVALFVGPLLEALRRAEEGVLARLRAGGSDAWRSLGEPGNSGRKIAAATAVGAMLAAVLLTGTYRVSADATLEGRTQRAVVAGFEGFIAEARVRAGDLVAADQLLARLDSKDLLLERRQREGRRAQLEREYREALSIHDRAKASVVRAQIEQADAESALVQERLARSEIRAPFEGVIVRGDLSQSLGSPVERGDLLFEIAPLDGYRIILAVDERDVSDVAVGQAGDLTLSALPNHPLPLTVERIIPISFDQDGRNAFRVEAALETPVAGLRPGMEGVGKIEIDRRRWLWIWTHELVGWLRLWAWSWWP